MNNEKPYHLMMMNQKPKKKSKEQMMKETFIISPKRQIKTKPSKY